ncbi:tyrosine-type recombinase/integrase [Haloarcula japonica]|uniref:tyrosine-type recombinase/integrase n=1 Tax=Haloarcula japonica TaxID=29282 RepID=UPI0039F6D368
MRRDDSGQFGTKHTLSDEYREYFEDYSDWVATHVDKERTRERLEAGVRAWLRFCEDEELDPLAADENDVRIYIDELVREEYAETTITRRVASVSKFYIYQRNDPRNTAEIDNPTEDISLPRDYGIQNLSEYVRVLDQEGKTDIISPSAAEVSKLFEHAPGKRSFTYTMNELVLRLFWETALRADEMSRVKMRNVDSENREITVRSAKLNRKEHPDLYHRCVWWSPDLDFLMKRWRPLRRNTADDPEYLFVNSSGEQLTPSYLSRIVKEAARRAGIQEPLTRDENGDVKQHLWTAHRLRHARITYLANQTDMTSTTFG